LSFSIRLTTELIGCRSQALHKSLPPFAPFIPVGLLPYLALFLLASTFTLTFYFSTSAPVFLQFYSSHRHLISFIMQITKRHYTHTRNSSCFYGMLPWWIWCCCTVLHRRRLCINTPTVLAGHALCECELMACVLRSGHVLCIE
jgi:hypothetical protein